MHKAAELTRTGIGLPAYFNDDLIIPALMNCGLCLNDDRDYCAIAALSRKKPVKPTAGTTRRF